MKPLTPPDCDLRDFPRMMIDIPRLRASEFDAIVDSEAWRAGLNLWLSSWHKVPAGALEDDDGALAKAAGLGRDLRSWRKVKAAALRGWVRCDDGLLYHPTVSEFALEAWLEKLAQALSSGAGNAKRHGIAFDPAPIEAEIDRCAGMLAELNPKSKALVRLSRRKPRPAPDNPPGDGPDIPPDGTEKPSRRDMENLPSGSQEKGTGTGKGTIYSEGKPSAPERGLSDFDAMAWSEAVQLLAQEGNLSEISARKFFGKLLSANGIRAKEMLPSITSAMINGTADPKSYLTKAAQAISTRQTNGFRKPQQVDWC